MLIKNATCLNPLPPVQIRFDREIANMVTFRLSELPENIRPAKSRSKILCWFRITSSLRDSPSRAGLSDPLALHAHDRGGRHAILQARAASCFCPGAHLVHKNPGASPHWRAGSAHSPGQPAFCHAILRFHAKGSQSLPGQDYPIAIPHPEPAFWLPEPVWFHPCY